MTAAELLFFDVCGKALPLYEAVKRWALEAFPDTETKVQKAQITFMRPGGWLVVSVPRRKADREAGCLIVTFSLPEAEASPRIMARTQISARRWTHHLLLTSPEDLDAQTKDWLSVSADMAKK